MAFCALAAYLVVVGAAAQPAVHAYFDDVAIRDTGTVWTSLTWHPGDARHFLPTAVLAHIEGPFQFVFLNAYYHAIGDLLPLTQRTTQFPNTVLAFAGALLAYRLGRRLDGRRFGLAFGLAFALAPWLGVSIRVSWVYHTASCLLQLLTLYLYVGFVLEPTRRLYRVGAPAALAAYLLTGLDWPAFFVALGLFLSLAGRLGDALRSRAMLLPGAVVGVYAVWTAALFVYGRLVEPSHADLWQHSFLVYPFVKVGGAVGWPPPGAMVVYALETLGLALPAAAWVLATQRPWRPAGNGDDRVAGVRRAWLLAMGAWAVVGLLPLLKLSRHVTYAFVEAVPFAALAAVWLARLSGPWWAVVLLVMVGWQLVNVWSSVPPAETRMDRRVLAAAAFLNERRPDLLAADRTAFLPWNEPANVGQYARGRNERIIMPTDFPAERGSMSRGSKVSVLTDFLDAYESRGTIEADWLVLSSDLLSSGSPAVPFYQRLRDDPQVDWIATFRDPSGRMLWLGEVRRGMARAGAAAAAIVDDGPLADVYARKYDWISFLKKNARYVSHY